MPRLTDLSSDSSNERTMTPFATLIVSVAVARAYLSQHDHPRHTSIQVGQPDSTLLAYMCSESHDPIDLSDPLEAIAAIYTQTTMLQLSSPVPAGTDRGHELATEGKLTRSAALEGLCCSLKTLAESSCFEVRPNLPRTCSRRLTDPDFTDPSPDTDGPHILRQSHNTESNGPVPSGPPSSGVYGYFMAATCAD